MVIAHVYINGEQIDFTFVRKIENMKEEMVISLKDFGLGNTRNKALKCQLLHHCMSSLILPSRFTVISLAHRV